MIWTILLACAPQSEPGMPGLPPGTDPSVDPATEPTKTAQGTPRIPGSFELLEPEEGMPTGSTTLVAGPTPGRMFAVDGFNDQLVLIDQEGINAITTRVPLAGEPSRITRVRERLFVTLREAGQLVVLDLQGNELQRVDVGLEPLGVVATSDGSRIYVASSLSGQVLELRGGDLQVLRSFPVAGEPRYLALDQQRGVLHVAALNNDALVESIDLQSGAASTFSMPQTRRGTGVLFTQRVSGDPWVDPANGDLIVPMVFVDARTPVTVGDEPDTPVQPSEPADNEGYGGSSVDPAGKIHPGKITPGVVIVSPQSQARVLFAASAGAAGVITSVRTAPTSSRIVATMQGSNAVIYLDPRFLVDNPGSNAGPDDAEPLSPTEAGFEHVASAVVRTCHGPASALWVDQDVWVHCPGQSALADGRPLFADIRIEANATNGTNATVVGEALDVRPLPVDLTIPPAVRQGHRLFTSDSIGAGGITCATCHVDGRADGITWAFEAGDRQTPSLAGDVSATAPFSWTAGVPSVEQDAMDTAELRMGGAPMNLADAEAIAAFVDWVRPVARPAPDTVSEQGRVVFEEAGCNNCHSGDHFTDGQTHTFRELAVDTPTLRGVGATAPYLRDGSAPTLHELLQPEDAEDRHGGLSEQQITELVAYLNTL